MYKRILVPIDPSKSSERAMELAIFLANQYGASLTGMVILDIKGIDTYIGPLPIGASKYAHEMEHKFIENAEKTIDELIAKFSGKCQEAGVNFNIHKLKGMPSSLIIEESRFFDLLLIGRQSNFNFAINHERGHTFEKVMANCLAPIMAVPENIVLKNITEGNPNVVIALDGSLEASGALMRFTQLISDKRSKVDLVMSHSDDLFSKYVLENSAELLKAYDLEQVCTHHTEENIIKYIDANFLETADLFVIGPRTTNAISEFFLGSFTKFLLKNTDQLLFIAR